MKYVSIFFLAFVSVVMPTKLHAQSFAITGDTVTGTGAIPIADNITNKTGSNLAISWHVDSTDFPAEWLTPAVFGICDNSGCYGNGTGDLWNATTKTGGVKNATYHSNAEHDNTEGFQLNLTLDGTPSGSHWVRVKMTDNGSGYSRMATFIVNRVTTGVTNITSAEEKTMLYPNPASNELNVVFDANADVKNIAVYNIIGKMMSVYKVAGSSANLNIESMPSGIYFLKLYGSKGNVITTRKFTKQ